MTFVNKRSVATAKRRRKIKEMIVNFKGGKCERCGYSKYIGALEFHHIDPLQKKFGLGMRGLTRSYEKVKEEASKCLLVCSNCHKELHAQINML